MEVPEFEETGLLPPGRTRVAKAAVQRRFVEDAEYSSSVRTDIWNDWLALTDKLQEVTTVCAAWLSGSFVTDKVDPGDLDCVYIIDARQLVVPPLVVLVASNQARRIQRDGQRNLQLDTFVLAWQPDLSPDGSARREYSAQRGYWDDFWSRIRENGASGVPALEDALPRRGYLEVVLDGFST